MRSKEKKADWSERKKQVVRELAEGTKTQREIAKQFHLKESSISRWKLDPEFIKAVDDITLSLERHSLAGILRRLDEQQENTSIGKNEWLKIEEFKAKLRGFDKTKVEHSGTIVQIIDNIPDKDENKTG